MSDFNQTGSLNEERSLYADIPGHYWMLMSEEDRTEYLALRAKFRNHQTSTQRDRSTPSILQDLGQILAFVDKQAAGREYRAIVCGVYKHGNYLCVNTQQLKSTMNRCKSSINNGFQQLGFSSVKTRMRQHLIDIIPCLNGDPVTLRRWTVRSCETTHEVAPPPPLPIPILGNQPSTPTTPRSAPFSFCPPRCLTPQPFNPIGFGLGFGQDDDLETSVMIPGSLNDTVTDDDMWLYLNE